MQMAEAMRREAWHESEEPFARAKRGLRAECHIKPTVVGGLPKGRPGLGKPARRVGAPLLSETPAKWGRPGAPGDRPTATVPQGRSDTPPRSNLAPPQQPTTSKTKNRPFLTQKGHQRAELAGGTVPGARGVAGGAQRVHGPLIAQ